MGKSKIEWTERTWNPIVGCSIVSPGCTHCYAMRQADRIKRMAPNPAASHYFGTTKVVNGNPVWTGEVALAPDKILTAPLRRRAPTTWFVNSMGDVFHESVPDSSIDWVFAAMALCPQHRFQLLTKRAERMRDYVCKRAGDYEVVLPQLAVALARSPCAAHVEDVAWPLPNVWLGVSAEDQQRADQRIPHLLATPAAVRFASCEPLLGPIDLEGIRDPNHFPGCLRKDVLRGREHHEDDGGRWTRGRKLDWVIAGGESGPRARPMHPDWARGLRDQCAAAGVPFFFKQWGEWLPWEPEHGPCWVSQNGRSEDHHALFPVEMDDDPSWDDGLWAIDGVTNHAAFQRVGKARAGAFLDGREHKAFPVI